MISELDNKTIPPYESFQEASPKAYEHYFGKGKANIANIYHEYLFHALYSGVSTSPLYCAGSINKLVFYLDGLTIKQSQFWSEQTNEAKSIRSREYDRVFKKFHIATAKLYAATQDEQKAESEGIVDQTYAKAVTEAAEDVRQKLKEVRNRIDNIISEDMFRPDEPDAPLIAYLDKGYAAIGEYLNHIEQHQFHTASDVKPATPIDELSALLSQSHSELMDKFKTSYPDTHAWLQAQEWKHPSDMTVRPDKAITKIGKIRREIDTLANELAGLNKLAKELIYRPSEYAKELDAANESWNKVKLHPADQTPPAPRVDTEANQRPYDDLLPSHDGATSHFNGFSNLDEPLTKILNLLPRLKGQPVTSAGAITSSADIDKVRGTTDDQMFARAQNAAEILAYDAKIAYTNAHNYILKNSNPDVANPDSELLPHSLNCAQFCADEIYPRIFQQSLALEQKVGELKKALAEQVGGGNPVGDGASNVRKVDFGGGRGK